MRTRLVSIAALSIAALIGTANAAQAYPQGPGGISDKPTTTTTAPPKGPNDKYSPTPTTQPPKGPGDLATPTTQPPQPGPKGPGDIAQPQPGPVVDPKPPTTPGDDEAGVGWDQPDVDSDGNVQGGEETTVDVDGESVETIPVANSEGEASNDDSTEAAAPADNDGGLSPFVLLGFAVLVAGLIAFAVARRRGDEQDAEQI